MIAAFGICWFSTFLFTLTDLYLAFLHQMPLEVNIRLLMMLWDIIRGGMHKIVAMAGLLNFDFNQHIFIYLQRPSNIFRGQSSITYDT